MRRRERAAVVAEFQGSVVGGRQLVLRDFQALAQAFREPMCYFGPAPQPVSASGIGDGFRESAWATRTACQEPNAFTGAADTDGDIRQRGQPSIGNADDLDAIEFLQIVYGRQDCVIEVLCFAIEVNILYAVAATDRRVVTTCLEQRIDQGPILEVGTVDNQREMEGRHVV